MTCEKLKNGQNQKKLMGSNDWMWSLDMYKMILEWREREHEDMDQEAMQMPQLCKHCNNVDC